MFPYLLLLISSARSDMIDNSIVGQPEVDCGSENITLGFNTKLPFEGRVYVKGLNANRECRFDANGSMSAATVVMPMESCGVRRSRWLNPPGINVSMTVVVSFHPKFETGADQAFRLNCFYMEASVTVDSSLDVSLMTTRLMEATAKSAADSVNMPVCSYEILNDSTNGHSVKHAAVGQIVYHRWRCVSDLVNKFCITIHSCVIEDGKGDRLQLLDTQGCAVDKSLMDNPDYTDDLTAVRSTQVFTYADRVAVYFQCQIDLFVKEQLKCPRPTCLISRKSRSAERLSQHHKLGVMDVNSELNAFDHFNPDSDEFAKDSDDICLSAGLFWNVSVVVMLVTMVAFINFWLLVTKLRCSITSARVKLV